MSLKIPTYCSDPIYRIKKLISNKSIKFKLNKKVYRNTKSSNSKWPRLRKQSPPVHSSFHNSSFIPSTEDNCHQWTGSFLLFQVSIPLIYIFCGIIRTHGGSFFVEIVCSFSPRVYILDKNKFIKSYFFYWYYKTDASRKQTHPHK